MQCDAQQSFAALLAHDIVAPTHVCMVLTCAGRQVPRGFRRLFRQTSARETVNAFNSNNCTTSTAPSVPACRFCSRRTLQSLKTSCQSSKKYITQHITQCKQCRQRFRFQPFWCVGQSNLHCLGSQSLLALSKFAVHRASASWYSVKLGSTRRCKFHAGAKNRT